MMKNCFLWLFYHRIDHFSSFFLLRFSSLKHLHLWDVRTNVTFRQLRSAIVSLIFWINYQRTRVWYFWALFLFISIFNQFEKPKHFIVDFFLFVFQQVKRNTSRLDNDWLNTLGMWNIKELFWDICYILVQIKSQNYFFVTYFIMSTVLKVQNRVFFK